MIRAAYRLSGCLFAVVFFSLLGSPAAHAAFVRFEMYSGWNAAGDTFYRLNHEGGPLLDGSVVMLVGLEGEPTGGFDDAFAEGNLPTYGDSLLTEMVNEGEILGHTHTGTVDGHGGVFYAGEYWIPDNITHVYFYFFHPLEPGATYPQIWPIQGTNAWGWSSLYTLSDYTNTFVGGYTVETGDDYTVSRTNHFAIIPEPTTGALFAVFAGMMFLGFPGFVKSFVRGENGVQGQGIERGRHEEL